MLDLFEQNWRDLWAGLDRSEPVGAVFTRPEIVQLILDLAGYTVASGRLAERRVLEPSCGDGAFTAAIVARLVESEREHATPVDWHAPILDDALRASDISAPSLAKARVMLVEQLTAAGCPQDRASELADCWLVHTDFLLADWPDRFQLVVGNPPYVRIEDLPRPVLQRYRALYETATDRADIYIAFFEKGLSLLADDGCLAFICANRWTKNRYGATLRRLVARRYHVRHYLNLEHTQPFASDVSAYPAIFLVDREIGAPTRAATLSDIEPATLATLRAESLRESQPGPPVSQFMSWYGDGGPWTTTCSVRHDVLARLDAFPTLEESAPDTRVGIGVATGADRVFVLDELSPDIERSRQIPMIMASDVRSQRLEWSGRYLVNPFSTTDDGTLVDLDAHPGLHRYLESHAVRLKGRHVARNRPRSWFRTIDRVWPELQHRPKLVIPDIQVGGVVGYDEGCFYPHHNLYWITSSTWDLRALQALLRSTFVLQQVRAYSVQMRGGSIRYQAQTLRRLRIPLLADLGAELLARLASVAASESQAEIDRIATEAFDRVGTWSESKMGGLQLRRRPA